MMWERRCVLVPRLPAVDEISGWTKEIKEMKRGPGESCTDNRSEDRNPRPDCIVVGMRKVDRLPARFL